MMEKTLEVYDGDGSAAFYRGWQQTGVDPSKGINKWTNASAPTVKKVGQLGSWATPGSLHPGGCNAVFGDGSVRFMKETTDVGVLRKLSRMGDGGVVSADSY